jgi:hypothetical protein
VIAAVSLLAYTGLLLTAGASRLVRAGWADRAPRLAIAAWLALNSSAIGSVILGGLALVVPTAGVSYHLAGLLAACAHDVRARYGHPGGAALAVAGVVLTFVVAARVGWCTVRTLVTARRDGQRHCQQLQAVVALAIVVAFPFLALSGPALTLIGSHCIDTVSSATHSAGESSD